MVTSDLTAIEVARTLLRLRTLDAIHLATALLHSQVGGPFAVLSTDDRVRDDGLALGLTVVP